MPTTKLFACSTLVAGLFLAAAAPAQQTTPATPSTTPAAPKASAGTAKKTTAGTTKSATTPKPLTTQKDKLSYSIGLNVGKNLKKDEVDVDTAVFLRGLKDALADSKPALSEADMRSALVALQTSLRAKEEARMKEEAAKEKALGVENKQKGDAFLAENKTKEGVVTLPSGLQYKVIKQGDGPKPTAEDTVKCEYRGTLIDGTEFDSSAKHGQAIKIPVGQVIKGWTEALQLMPVGSKWQLFIPPDLAYGDHSPGGPIGPNATLIFDVELVSIEPKAPPKAAAGDAGDATGAAPAAKDPKAGTTEATPPPTSNPPPKP